MATRDDVLASVRASFPPGICPDVLRALDEYGVEPHERERERVQLAIVKLSEGSQAKLTEYVIVAKRDYRDILLWADDPAEAAIEGHKKTLLEMFKKLGMEPPEGLE